MRPDCRRGEDPNSRGPGQEKQWYCKQQCSDDLCQDEDDPLSETFSLHGLFSIQEQVPSQKPLLRFIDKTDRLNLSTSQIRIDADQTDEPRDHRRREDCHCGVSGERIRQMEETYRVSAVVSVRV